MINFLLFILFATIYSCQFKQENDIQTTNIDRTLQSKVTSILENKLSELNALSGQAIKLMEVQIKLF